MKKLSFLMAILPMLFCACSSFNEENNALIIPATPDLQAGFAEDTRTYVENNKYLRWHEDDRLTAFYGNTLNRQYKFNGKTGDNSGTFSLVPSGELGTGNAFDRIYAVYPYNETATITDEGEISLSLPAVQSYAEKSFGKGANTMIAVTENLEDTFLAFKNACGYLKLKLYGDNVTLTSIEVKGNNNEKIAGAATATIAFGEAPQMKMTDDATTTVTINCGEGVTLGTTAETATEFWVVLPEATFTKGLTIKATGIDGGVFEKSTDNEVVITRNNIQPMAAVEITTGVGNNNNNGSNIQKTWILSKITKISTCEDSGVISILFEYDEYNRLIKFKYADEHLHNYTYTDTQILCGGSVEYIIDCTLSNNKIKSVQAGDWLYMTYTYDNQGYVDVIDNIAEEYSMKHTWEDGNIVRLSAVEDSSYYCVAKYGNVTNNINFDLNRIVTMSNPSAYTTVRGTDTEYATLCLYAMGYIGHINRNHVTSITHYGGSSGKVYNYSWEYDSLSRPKKCTTKSSSGYIHTYYFEYQE